MLPGARATSSRPTSWPILTSLQLQFIDQALRFGLETAKVNVGLPHLPSSTTLARSRLRLTNHLIRRRVFGLFLFALGFDD